MKAFTIKDCKKIFQGLEVLKREVRDADPQSMQVCQDTDKVFNKYKHMYEDLEKTVLPSLLKYFCL